MTFEELCTEVQSLLKDTKPGGMVSRLKVSQLAPEFIQYYKDFTTTKDPQNDINIEKVYL